MKIRFTHLDAMQGRSEEQTEMYLKYFKGVPQLLAPQGARSSSGASA